MKPILWATLFAVFMPFVSCAPVSHAAEIDVAAVAAAPTHQQRAELGVRLTAWYECEECVDNELADLLALAAVARYRQQIIDNLAAALQHGPTAARRKQAEWHYQQRWQRMADAGQRDPRVAPRIDRQKFDEDAAKQLTKLYRVRAAIALGRLGDRPVREILEPFANDADPDVRRIVTDSLNQRSR